MYNAAIRKRLHSAGGAGIDTHAGSLALIFVALGVGSFAKGVTGIGLPLFAVPLLANFIGVERAVVIMVIPSLVSNLWLVWVHRRAAPPLAATRTFLAFGVLGGLAGTWLLAEASARALTLMLALWLGIYLVIMVVKPGFRLRNPRTAALPWGFLAGSVQGATGMSAPVIAPFLSGMGLVKEAFVFCIALAFSLFSVAQVVAMAHFGLFAPDRVLQGLAALVPVAIFLPAGIRVARRLSAAAFGRFLFAILLLLELRLLYDGIWRL